MTPGRVKRIERDKIKRLTMGGLTEVGPGRHIRVSAWPTYKR
jgi:hypothetical protein